MTATEVAKELVKLIAQLELEERKQLTRAESMAQLYGEAVSKEQAAKLLNCSTRTVNNYIYDGKIRMCCDGSKVDVRSMAEYIEG